MNRIKPELVGLCSERLKSINELSEAAIKQGELAGTVTLVARRGMIAHLSACGMSSIESGAIMQPDAIFRIYSMTKPVTTVAAMMLYERGCFDLTTPISMFIPEFKSTRVFTGGTAVNYNTTEPNREINMSDLLSHTAGLTYDFKFETIVDELYRANGISGLNMTGSSDDFVKAVAKMPLLFSPGTRWNYSVATDVLGRIIEIISDSTLDDFLKKNIFEPLDMKDTGFYVSADNNGRFTSNYIHHTAMPKDKINQYPGKKLFLIDDPRAGNFNQPPAMFSGGGGLVSSAIDYLKFATLLLNKGSFGDVSLLKPETIDLMTSNQLPSELDDYCFLSTPGLGRPGIGMGYGVAVTLDPARANLLGSRGDYGWSGAANTCFVVDPKEQLIAIYLTQLFPFDQTQLRFRDFKTAVYRSIIH